MENDLILNMEIIGIIFISILGTILHFTFNLSGKWKPIAIISAVNESVWEHLKIGYWPALIWAIIEFFIFGKNTSNFLFAKSITLILIPLIIVLLFYSYTYFVKHIFIIDLLIFWVAIIVAQIVSYRLILINQKYLILNVLGGFIIVITLILFSLFSYFPPRLKIFRDYSSGKYGIIKK
jgi:hypothetical protein